MEHTVDGRTAEQEFLNARVSELASAACRGDEAAVEKAVGAGVDPNYMGPEGVTPLLWAVNCESVGGIRSLLRKGADPNLKPKSKFSATYAASMMSNPSILEVLLQNGGDPNSYYGDDKGNSALIQALEVGWDGRGWKNFYTLLQKGADINLADEHGATVATRAVTFGEFEKVAELLERGYSHDLEDLGRTVAVRPIDPSEYPDTARARAKVIALLSAKGIAVPDAASN